MLGVLFALLSTDSLAVPYRGLATRCIPKVQGKHGVQEERFDRTTKLGARSGYDRLRRIDGPGLLVRFRDYPWDSFWIIEISENDVATVMRC